MFTSSFPAQFFAYVTTLLTGGWVKDALRRVRNIKIRK